MTRRNALIYGILFAIWALVLVWQSAEHKRVSQSARAGLINRARDISNTLGLVMRSQRRFGGVISKERLESALKELVNPGELNAIALLNEAGDVVASAGGPLDFHQKGGLRNEEHWGSQTVTLMNLVELGTNVTQDLETSNLTIVIPRNEMFPPRETNRPPATEIRTNESGLTTNILEDARPPRRSSNRGRPRGPGDNRSGFGRPFWMNEEEYKTVIQKQGVHSVVLVMSAAPVISAASQDFRLRATIGLLATISVVGTGFALRNMTKSSELRLRLVRASELNSHLKEMNLAAAGLAHETRNPLNIIRGLAQMISRQEDAPAEIRKRSRDILNETDRVTGQLNEFINYSRPRQVNRAAVQLGSIVSEVARALSYDIQEKNIRLQISDEPIAVEADEQLLRQALFNLVLNAIQAVNGNGEIQIAVIKQDGTTACLEVRDNGPGVAVEHRSEIFKPYFTTHQKGTGLGLAVVQQIVLAHGWEIECVSNQPQGAIFRISHLKIASPS